MQQNILIYGATGYTGKLLVRHLLKHGLQPILAGRSEKVLSMGERLGCEARVFTVDEASRKLDDVDVIVNLAGPFDRTQPALIEACIQTRTSYLDIAGEAPEMERAFAYDESARAAQVLVMPGAGFGVVPTDIASRLAANQVENPTHLTIAYATLGGASRGTLKTVLGSIEESGIVVRNGKMIAALPAMKSYPFEVDGLPFNGVYNPWRADLYTAQRSTGIANIETYSVFPGFVVKMMKGRRLWLRNLLLNNLLGMLPEGPTTRQLKGGRTYISAIARNALGQEGRAQIVGPEAYLFTAECLRSILARLLRKPKLYGVRPPSDFGSALIEPIEGVQLTVL